MYKVTAKIKLENGDTYNMFVARDKRTIQDAIESIQLVARCHEIIKATITEQWYNIYIHISIIAPLRASI